MFLGHTDSASLPFKKGDWISIPKGCPYTSTRYPGTTLKTGTTHIVKVFSVDTGCDAYVNYHEEQVPPRNPSIQWVGSGGYWHRADINDILELQANRS